MENINILINSLKGGGTEKVCSLLASYLSDSGYKVNLYVLDNDGNDYPVSCNVNVKYLGKSSSIRSFPVLAKLLRTEKINKILVFNHELSLVLFFIKKLYSLDFKIISRINNTLSKTIVFKSLKYKFVVGGLMKLFYKKMDFFIFQSNGIKLDMISNYGVKDNYSIINNPIVTSNYTGESKKDKDIDILYVGRLVEQKNVKDILHVVSSLAKKGKEYKLSIVGDGPKRNELERYCKLNSLEQQVTFWGHQSNIDEFYHRAKLTVLTSHNEGFPNVLVESLSYGVPIVSYDCPSGPSDIIISGKNGVLVEHLNVIDFEQAVDYSLNHSWDENEILDTTRKFDVDFIARQYQNVIKNV
ncbi:glycosyltransferase [Vibrio alginolyticus]|uniref:glycosyltransferase n=1 Tax=Vibrio TaxID=662 RepID=UPI001BD39C91|nr:MULTISPECIES: glycosyltransferase [Vibrio]MBS9827281.1 glycosyltransferase [Vibrio alginolyticus]MBT0027563.1 glycosyltransferase [Vibrio alginolyticus]MCA2438778.1 glycosyltransferase [Vibrio alginolyticus]MDW1728036.1 glycosyltransferase [Vibrio sp. Vb2356]MDW1931373.1 glycosyltransferase [Vibrio sp. 970]